MSFISKLRRLIDDFSEEQVVRVHSISGVRELLKRNGYRPLAFYDGSLRRKSGRNLATGPSIFRVLAIARPV